MTYAKSTKVLNRMRVYLEVLAAKKDEASILFETNEPKNLAYRLREANKVLRDLDEHPLKILVDKYTFKEQYPPAKMGVIAKLKVPEVRVSTLYNNVYEEIIRKDEVTDIDIISYMISHTNISRVYFPSFDKDNSGELISIVNWGKFNNYNVQTEDKPGITIVKSMG
jgi:hypothetical protein